MHSPIKLASSASQRIGRLLCRKVSAQLNSCLLHGWGWRVGSFAAKWKIWSNMDRCLHTCGAAVNWTGRGRIDGWPPLRELPALSTERAQEEEGKRGVRLCSQWGETFPWNTSWWVSPTKGGVTHSALLQNSLVSVWIRACCTQRGAQVNGSWMLINWCHFFAVCHGDFADRSA